MSRCHSSIVSGTERDQSVESATQPTNTAPARGSASSRADSPTSERQTATPQTPVATAIAAQPHVVGK